MRKFTDPNHLPATPKSYTLYKDGKENRIHWHNSMPFGSFYAAVSGFASANGLPVPSAEDVEDHVCGQMGSGWCTSDPNYQRPAASPRPSGGCKACGRR